MIHYVLLENINWIINISIFLLILILSLTVFAECLFVHSKFLTTKFTVELFEYYHEEGGIVQFWHINSEKVQVAYQPSFNLALHFWQGACRSKILPTRYSVITDVQKCDSQAIENVCDNWKRENYT